LKPAIKIRDDGVGASFPYCNYAKDGRFLMIKSPRDSIADTETPASLVVEQHWFSELKRLVSR
jgi:hypothetical protein